LESLTDPEITKITLQDDDVYVFLASDGVREFLQTELVVEIIAENTTPSSAAKGVVEEATAAWEQDSEDEARDDITCIVIFLKNLPSSTSFNSSSSDSSSSSSDTSSTIDS